MAELLSKRGLPASVSVSEPFTISGTVTRAPAPDAAVMYTPLETQVEARVSQGGTTVGVMQVNAVLLHTNVTGGTPATLLGTLIAQAIEPSRASVVGRTIADALLRARAGEKEAAYSDRALPLTTAPPQPRPATVPEHLSSSSWPNDREAAQLDLSAAFVRGSGSSYDANGIRH